MLMASSLSSSTVRPIVMKAAATLRGSALFCAARRAATTATPSGREEAGWSYEQVDASTGRTPLDALYDERLQRIQAVFNSPLPPLPRDGNVSPDFLLGFAHYDYRLRDQYRAVVARALDVPVAALQLSVAWSGRFDVTRFNRVQKVCGVRLVAEDAGLSEETRGKIKRFVRVVNERQSEALLAVHMVQASEAIPEVEFAAAERDAVVAGRLREWMHQHIFRPHLVVVVYGANDAGGRQTTCQNGDVDRQRAFIEDKWMKAFFRRRVVPHVLSFAQLTEMLQEAVRKGEVEGVGVLAHGRPHKEGDAAQERGKTGEEEGKNKTNEGGEEEHSTRLLSLDDGAAWRSLLCRALFQRHDDRAAFPLLFLHGNLAGGVEEMRYLLHNREALDAALLHPNDVAFKKKFMSRLRSSHSRLRMAEEMSV